MYQPTDLKKGTVVQIDGKPYRVVEYGQKVMGRGGSIVNVRLKNLNRRQRHSQDLQGS
jgi:translation elongation factor P/translation initiation factor 5A